MTTRVVFVCTANQCRSPMAEVLLRSRLDAAGIDDVVVSSSGRLRGGVAAAAGSASAMARRGISLEGHRSAETTVEDVLAADLVVCMAREHVRDVVVAAPVAFPRVFTLKELLRRGRSVGPRRAGESVAAWLAMVHDGRSSRDLLGDDPADDVVDPMGGPDEAFEATAVELEGLIIELVDLVFARH